MSELADAPELLPSPDIPPEPTPDDRRLRLFELALVVGVSFLGPTVTALYHGWNGQRAAPSAFNELTLLLDAMIGISVLAYVLYCQGRWFEDIGLTARSSDIAWGLLVSFFSWTMAHAVSSVVVTLVGGVPRLPTHLPPYTGWLAWLAVIPLAALEELIVRAYLMTEVAELTGSMALAVVASVGLQFLYHLYLGVPRALVASGSFLVAALFYANTRRATPLIVAHSLHNFWVMAR